MRNVTIIKKVLGPYLQSEGFEYAGYDYYSGWKFKREKEDITHWIFIAKSRWDKELWIESGTGEGKAGRKRPDAVVRLDYFKEDTKTKEMKKQYHDEETLEQVLIFFREQIRDYFLPGFNRLEKEIIKWKITITLDMHRRLYEEKDFLTEALFKRYGNLSTDEDRMVSSIMNILIEHYGEEAEEFEETLLGLAAYLGDMIVNNLEDCHWKWDSRKENTGYYVFHKEFYEGPLKEMYNSVAFLSPLNIINEAWQEKDEKKLQFWYNDQFVNRRKTRKRMSIEMKEETDKEIDKTRYQYAVIQERMSILMEKFQFRYTGKSRLDYQWCRSTPEGNQKIILNENNRTGDMWISAVVENGNVVEIQDIREGLFPYAREEYFRNDGYISERFMNIISKMEEQIKTDFMPVLESPETYLLKWKLSPEMEKREFYERDELLEKLMKNYGEEIVDKKELPDFIKRILKENEDSTMEEFGDTLLGLGILLGETAIKEIEGSHWLWDAKRLCCRITYRNEVTGIDPAFSLNYAWQKRKLENVDKLCRDLMEGNYIEDRTIGGYEIEDR